MSGFGLEFHVVLAALLIDAATGDPPWLYRHAPHPVAALGKLVEVAERALYAPSPRWRSVAGGVATVAVVVSAGVAVAWLIDRLLVARWANGWVVEAVLASSLLAFRGLHDHAAAVARGLEQSLAAGRDAVSHVVGRDPASLDEAGIARGAIESVAENFSDGVVAPVFWYALAGLPGLLAYKAVNTLDSMIGHRTDRYRHFGTAAARLDDVVNWLARPPRGSVLRGGGVAAARCERRPRVAGDDSRRRQAPLAERRLAGSRGRRRARFRPRGATTLSPRDGRRCLDGGRPRPARRR